MRTGPYSDRVREKLERMRGVRRARVTQHVQTVGTAWRMATQGYGWEDIAISCGVDASTARKLVGVSKRQTT